MWSPLLARQMTACMSCYFNRLTHDHLHRGTASTTVKKQLQTLILSLWISSTIIDPDLW